MPKHRGRGRTFGFGARVGAMLAGAAIGAAFVGLVVGLDASAARAGDDDNASALTKFMQTLGLKRGPDVAPEIDVSERSPLVVPPTRDLPPPVAGAAAPVPDWPQDPKTKPRKHAKAAVVPATPDAGTVQTAAPPPHKEKAWYNPTTWFDREEYATFTGEPGRDSLTDPPVGYRTPSPAHPYGIGPEKPAKPKAAAATPAAAQTAPPAAPQPEASPATAAQPAPAQPAAAPAATQPESQSGK